MTAWCRASAKFDRWGVLTIGAGLGNARFTNRGEKDKAKEKQKAKKVKKKSKD